MQRHGDGIQAARDGVQKTLPTGEIMTASPKTIRPTALAAEAVAIMNEKSITSLFVVEDERPVGLIHIHDLLRAGVA